jgi:excisionase family DNA binding protein
MHAPDERTYLSRSEVAEMFSVSPNTVTRWAEAGILPCVRTLGGHRRYERNTILELARTQLEEEMRVETITLSLPQLYGDHQVRAVRQVLLDLPGVQELGVSPAFHQVQVTYDPERLAADEIRACLAQIGLTSGNGSPVPEMPSGRSKDPAWDHLGVRMTQTYRPA